MFGLVKKDLLMIKSNFKIMAIILIVYGVMAFQGIIDDISVMISFMSVIMMISTFSYDAYNKWDAYAVTLPDGRKNAVRAKYLATLLLIVLTALIIVIIEFVITYMRTNTIEIEKVLSMILGSVAATIIVESLMYPAIYKFGVEKARIGIFVFVFGVSIVCGILSQFIDMNSIINSLSILNNYWFIVLPISVVIILYISYKVSEKIYLKKEY